MDVVGLPVVPVTDESERGLAPPPKGRKVHVSPGPPTIPPDWYCESVEDEFVNVTPEPAAIDNDPAP